MCAGAKLSCLAQPMQLTRHASFRYSFTIKAIYPNSVAVAYLHAHVS